MEHDKQLSTVTSYSKFRSRIMYSSHLPMHELHALIRRCFRNFGVAMSCSRYQKRQERIAGETR